MAFEDAQNLEAFAKIAIYGRQGSGKSRTAAEYAVGISNFIKPSGGTGVVGYIDTETGSNPLKTLFENNGIQLKVERTRSLKDVCQGIADAEKAHFDALIIDSVTHVWNKLKEDYLKIKKRDQLMIYDWGPLKRPWYEFVTIFLNSNIHIIACGRAGYVYEERERDDGKREQVIVDTKMKAEGEFEYETALTVEMELVKVGQLEGDRTGRVFVNRATILKDRADVINGKQFDFPTFTDIRPWFETLNIGGVHAGVDTTDGNRGYFEDDAVREQRRNEQRRKQNYEELIAQLMKMFPGSSDKAKEKRGDVIEWATKFITGKGMRTPTYVENTISFDELDKITDLARLMRGLWQIETERLGKPYDDHKALWDAAVEDYLGVITPEDAKAATADDAGVEQPAEETPPETPKEEPPETPKKEVKKEPESTEPPKEKKKPAGKKAAKKKEPAATKGDQQSLGQ